MQTWLNLLLRDLPLLTHIGWPTCPGLSCIFLVFALKLPHSGKLLSSQQTGLAGHSIPTKHTIFKLKFKLGVGEENKSEIVRLCPFYHTEWQTPVTPRHLLPVEQPGSLHAGGQVTETCARLFPAWLFSVGCESPQEPPLRSIQHLRKLCKQQFFFTIILYRTYESVQPLGLSLWVYEQLRVSTLRGNHATGMSSKITSLNPGESKAFWILTPVIIELIFTRCICNLSTFWETPFSF